VASWLLPGYLRPHFFHLYAYCRWADDLADETGDPRLSLQRLDTWESQLDACYAGRAEHPLFVALHETIEAFSIPRKPFLDLLVAFRRDQQAGRYETMDELLDYCRYSANPVGRLVLYLGRCAAEARLGTLSDAVCTGLQLANFWQDMARDADRGRCYLPRDLCRRHGYTDAMLQRRETNDAFRAMIRAEVDRAEGFLRQGKTLAGLVPRSLRIDVALFYLGGLEVLRGIRRIDYDVWTVRPVVGRWAKLRLFARALPHRWRDGPTT